VPDPSCCSSFFPWKFNTCAKVRQGDSGTLRESHETEWICEQKTYNICSQLTVTVRRVIKILILYTTLVLKWVRCNSDSEYSLGIHCWAQSSRCSDHWRFKSSTCPQTLKQSTPFHTISGCGGRRWLSRHGIFRETAIPPINRTASSGHSITSLRTYLWLIQEMLKGCPPRSVLWIVYSIPANGLGW